MTTAEVVGGKQEVERLDTPHYFPGCSCELFTRVVSIEYPVTAEIRVRACTEIYGRRPVADALDLLSDAIGMRFVDNNEACSIVGRYSSEVPEFIVRGAEPVTRSGFSRTYYLRRDIFRACIASKRDKCFECGDRMCRDTQHAARHRELLCDIAMMDRMSSGFVYLMLHEPTQYVKVGFSSEPAKRLRTHAVSIPGKLSVLGVVPGGRTLEGAIHEDLSDWLVPGHQEWFFYSPHVREYLSRISAVYEKDPASR
jgi:hypothetical protein